ncbi:MAG: hypothetical protein KTR14_00805 [Vampirovibrio sp.]|nr:hypothetical protein [Vampirovibrio sp.]
MAILGAGGLGKGMAKMVTQRPGFTCVAMADSQGYCYETGGLSVDQVLPLETVATYPNGGMSSDQGILELLQAHGHDIDVIFMALPNFPVSFFADTVKQIATQTPFKGVMVDALKRTTAVEKLLSEGDLLKSAGILYITGAGATPGFLTTVAAVAAQSFVEVQSVNIHFGVGVANWETYRATIREDFLHLDGFDADKVAAMSDADVEAELEKRNGLLELVEMEHADDIILELAGICPRDRVTVGGLVDTRNAKKPVSTTVTVTGTTLSGAVGSHQFTVSDATTMVDNVCGPALGFLKRGVELFEIGQTGIITSADIMPKGAFAVESQQARQPAAKAIAAAAAV